MSIVHPISKRQIKLIRYKCPNYVFPCPWEIIFNLVIVKEHMISCTVSKGFPVKAKKERAFKCEKDRCNKAYTAKSSEFKHIAGDHN